LIVTLPDFFPVTSPDVDDTVATVVLELVQMKL